jgi:hypothetical protein
MKEVLHLMSLVAVLISVAALIRWLTTGEEEYWYLLAYSAIVSYILSSLILFL